MSDIERSIIFDRCYNIDRKHRLFVSRPAFRSVSPLPYIILGCRDCEATWFRDRKELKKEMIKH